MVEYNFNKILIFNLFFTSASTNHDQECFTCTTQPRITISNSWEPFSERKPIVCDLLPN